MDKWCRYLNDITSEDLQWGREWKIICKFSLLEWLICHQLIMVRCVSCCSSLKIVLFGKRHKLWWCEVGIVVGNNSSCNIVSNEIRCTSVSEFVNLPEVGEIILHSDRVVFVNDGVDRCLPCFGLLSASGFMFHIELCILKLHLKHSLWAKTYIPQLSWQISWSWMKFPTIARWSPFLLDML